MENCRRLLSLFFALYCAAVHVSAQPIVSIDCGRTGSDIYKDPAGINWIADDPYISTGVTGTTQTSNSVSQLLHTLRYFPTRKKNCYSFPGATVDAKYLIRAQFYYGNYDKKLSPPTFDLQFDGNYWGSVDTSGDEPVVVEMIYVTRGSTISVCVAQTQPGNIPFISSIEIRGLDPVMYKSMDTNYALLTNQRIAFGSAFLVRSPDDLYDRLWTPSGQLNGVKNLTSDLTFMDTAGLDDKPPAKVMLNAVGGLSASAPMSFYFSLHQPSVRAYYSLYFSELVNLDTTTQSRSFSLLVNGQPQLAQAIVPPYMAAFEVYNSNISLSTAANFSLVPTSTSTLPPIINALELFTLSKRLTDGTDSNDLQELGILQTGYDQLQSWTGDPCLPAGYTWDWLNCSASQTPRVTALYLNGFQLTGVLPDFSTLSALEIIDLHNNSLSGEIPSFLGDFPNLKELNLADNNFSGSLPSSLTSNKNIKLDVSGNSGLCLQGQSCQSSSSTVNTVSSSGKKKKSDSGVVAGAVIPTILFFWVLVGVLIYMLRRRQNANTMAALNAGPGRMDGGTGKLNVHGHPPPHFQRAGGQAVGAYEQSPANCFTVEIQQPVFPDDTSLVQQQDTGADGIQQDLVFSVSIQGQ